MIRWVNSVGARASWSTSTGVGVAQFKYNESVKQNVTAALNVH